MSYNNNNIIYEFQFGRHFWSTPDEDSETSWQIIGYLNIKMIFFTRLIHPSRSIILSFLYHHFASNLFFFQPIIPVIAIRILQWYKTNFEQCVFRLFWERFFFSLLLSVVHKAVIDVVEKWIHTHVYTHPKCIYKILLCEETFICYVCLSSLFFCGQTKNNHLYEWSSFQHITLDSIRRAPSITYSRRMLLQWKSINKFHDYSTALSFLSLFPSLFPSPFLRFPSSIASPQQSYIPIISRIIMIIISLHPRPFPSMPE